MSPVLQRAIVVCDPRMTSCNPRRVTSLESSPVTSHSTSTIDRHIATMTGLWRLQAGCTCNRGLRHRDLVVLRSALAERLAHATGSQAAQPRASNHKDLRPATINTCTCTSALQRSSYRIRIARADQSFAKRFSRLEQLLVTISALMCGTLAIAPPLDESDA